MFSPKSGIFFAVLCTSMGCRGAFTHVEVSGGAQAMVPGLAWSEPGAFEVAFGEVTGIPTADPSDADAEGVRRDDIVSVGLTSFSLENVTDQDMSFLMDASVYLHADDMEPLLLAKSPGFEEDGPTWLLVEDVEMVDYMLADGVRIEADVWGTLPDEATILEATYTLRVGVTFDGVIRAAKAAGGDNGQ